MFLLTGTEFRPKFLKTHYLKFVKLEVARNNLVRSAALYFFI